MTAKCKHPIVKIVAREEDAEFVECQKCGEVFDSAEFSDIAIEEEEALAETPGDVHRISAGMFTIGYGLAFLIPLVGGAAWDRTGIATVSLAPVAIGALCLLLAPWGLKTGGREL